MSKRARSSQQEDASQQQRLGASEFAAVLNGQDPQAILNVLKRFVKIVRRERSVALSVSKEGESIHDEEEQKEETSSSSDNDSVDGSDEDHVSEQQRQKRFRKDEVWKEDTSDYKVPFVGTSHARGSVGKVVPGQWPTGLLGAYLAKSPMAIELSDDTLIPGVGHIHKTLLRRKLGKTSHAIFRVYLQALAELVTAAIPKEKLVLGYIENAASDDEVQENTNQPPPQPHRFLSDLIKRRLSGLLSLLKEETANGKGKAGILGGCGVLAQYSLRILRNLSMVNRAAARQVARGIEQGLSEGVLRFLLKQQTTRARSISTDDGDESSLALLRENARTAAIELVTSLVQSHSDAVVFSCISSPGARDRKIPPGILVLALKEGLTGFGTKSSAAESDAHVALHHSVKHFLSSVRDFLAKRKSSLNMDLFSKDAMQNISQLALCAPRLSDENPFEKVLSASETYSEITSLQDAGVEARRLLFTLLAVPNQSPLLQAATARNKFAIVARQQAVRCLLLLLDGDHSLNTQRFLQHAITITPELLPAVFKEITFPDTRKVYPYVARLNLVSLLVRRGPTMQQCLKGPESNYILDKEEDIVPTILPLALKKQELIKVLQSRHPLLVSETLKLLVFVISRCRDYLESVREPNEAFYRQLTKFASNWIPDPGTIFSVMLQADHARPSSSVVVRHACDTVLAMEKAMPQLLLDSTDLKLDWTKLLSVGFEKAPLLLQIKILKVLLKVQNSQQMSPTAQIKSCRRLIAITIATTSPRVEAVAREISLKLLSGAIPCRVKEMMVGGTPFEYEFSCWLDGVTTQTLDELMTCLQESSLVSFRLMTEFARAWQQSKLTISVPFLPVSSLLIYALRYVPRASRAFTLLTCQVAMKCLLQDTNPLPLAALIWDAYQQALNEKPAEENVSFELLAQYCNSLIRFEEFPDRKRHDLLASVFDHLFSRQWFQRLFRMTEASSNATVQTHQLALVHRDGLAMVRNLVHLVTIFGGSSLGEIYVKNLLALTPLALSRDRFDADDFRRLRLCLSRVSPRDFDRVTLVASVRWKHHSDDFLEVKPERHPVKSITGLLNLHGTEIPLDQAGILYLYFVRPFLPQSVLTRRLLSLLRKPSERSIDSRTLNVLTIQILLEMDVPAKDLDHDLPHYLELFSSLVKVWMDSSSWPVIRATNELLDALEGVLSSWLRARTLGSSVLLAALADHSDEALVARCLARKTARDTEREDSSCCGLFVSALVACDVFRFGTELLRQLSGLPSTKDVFGGGFLDNALLLVLERDCEMDRSHQLLTVWRETFISVECEAIANFDRASGNSAQSTFLNLVRLLNTKLIEHPQVSALAEALVDFISENLLSKTPSIVLLSAQVNLLECSVKLCCLFPDRRTNEAARLSTNLLRYLCAATPRALRVLTRRKSVSDCESLLSAAQQLAWLQKVLDKSLACMGASGVAFDSVIRSCLRYGLGATDSHDFNTMLICLRVVKSLVSAGSGDSPVMNSLVTAKPIAARVFEMVTSHSGFRSILDTSKEPRKLEVIRLLLLCISNSNEIDFDLSVSQVLLQCYNAGIDDIDTELRKLLLKFLTLADSDHPVYMSELRWRDVGRRVTEVEWDWLLDAVDTTRVHATVRSFPIDDSVDPKTATSSSTSSQLSQNEREDGGQRGPMPYSPGFLLPLVLAALEDSCCSSSAVEKSQMTVTIQESTVTVVQRFFDKGLVSLALMALCSNCPQIRRLSISILGLVGSVIHSKQASESGSWRERPQLAMILDSIQRALAAKLEAGQDRHSVPQLSGVAALFLARSCVVVSRPGDRLYAAINRTFLRIQKNHGAFQDLWRLPAFITLLCSSADDPDQVSSERVWALTFLGDGFLDQSCYKPLVACHGVELLLTSINDARWRLAGDKKEEYALLLRVLQTIIARGGDKCGADLIKRVGLISFLRSCVSERPIYNLLPTLKLQVLFLQLVVTTLRIAGKMLSGEDFSAATAGFGNLIISFYLESPFVDKKGESGDTTTPVIVTHVGSALTSLAFPGVELDVKGISGVKAGPIRNDGVTLVNTCAFLSVLGVCHITMALSAVCCLPSACSRDDNLEAARLSIHVLHEAQKIDNNKNLALAHAMHKISEFATFFRESFDRDGSILRLVLGLRHACSTSAISLKAWNMCVSCLVVPEGGVDFEQESIAHSVLGRKLVRF